jgi:hypothetical protein
VRPWSTSRSRRGFPGLFAGLCLALALSSAGQSSSAAAAVPANTAVTPAAASSGPLGARALAAAALLPAAPIRAPRSAAADAVLVALFPSELSPHHATVESVLDRLANHPPLALGMASATQAIYDPVQALLDISQGARIQMNRYDPLAPPELDLDVARRGPSVIGGWPSAVSRAETAPATALPGLLAGSVPGGAAFVGLLGGPYAGIPAAATYFRGISWRHPGAIIAADRSGAVRQVSLGDPASLVRRTERALRSRHLVVVELSAGQAGDGQLGALLAARRPRELVIALQSPPQLRGSQTLWIGVAGAGVAGSGRMVTSGSTHVPGMVVATDVSATVLRALGIPIPSQVQGQPITTGGSRDVAYLKAFRGRIGAVNGRQLPALESFLLAWGVLILLLGTLADRRGLASGMRAGGLAALWLPSLALLAAALRPTRLLEIAILSGGSLVLGLATDRLITWPRAPVVPAVVGLFSYAIDLARGSPLIDTSVFGPSPLAGVRFYGVDNDLEIASTLLILALVAATVRRRDRSVRNALILVAAGFAGILVVSPGRLGADVGGIFTIGAGVGVAALMMLPRVTWRSVALALIAPAVALVGLAGIDMATKGNSDFLRNVVQAPSGGTVWDIVQRRYEVAWSILGAGEIPLMTLIALLGATYAIRHRRRVFAAVAPDALWPACLAGGFAAAVSCAVFNDSGVSELILGTGGVACLAAYVRARPVPLVRPAPPGTKAHGGAGGAGGVGGAAGAGGAAGVGGVGGAGGDRVLAGDSGGAVAGGPAVADSAAGARGEPAPGAEETGAGPLPAGTPDPVVHTRRRLIPSRRSSNTGRQTSP